VSSSIPFPDPEKSILKRVSHLMAHPCVEARVHSRDAPEALIRKYQFWGADHGRTQETLPPPGLDTIARSNN
jgi:hypothetical protein